MDISQSSISGYQTDKRTIAASSSETKAATVSSRARESTDAGQQSLQQLNLKEGQVIKGQVIDHRYNEVTIQLKPSDQTISAKLNGNIPLSIGQEANFQVTGSSADSLVLKYLPPDLSAAADNLIQKALSASGFSLTEKNRAIVQELLNHNMPVDKQTLQTIIKFSHMNRTASPLTLVLMYKNHIPMTPENITQFEAYQNGTNRLLNNIRTVSAGIQKLIISEEAPNPEFEQAGMGDSPLPADTTASSVSLSPATDKINAAGNPLLQNSEADALARELLPADPLPLNTANDETIQNSIPKLLQLNDKLMDLLSLTDPENAQGSLTNQTIVQNNTQVLADFFSPRELTALLGAMKEFDLPNQLKSQIKSGSVSLGQLLDYIRQSLGTMNEDTAGRFLASPEYGKLLENALLQKWTVSPEQLAEKTPINELYQNLKDDMEQISTLLKDSNNNAQAETIKDPVMDTQQNLQFMKDLNDAFTYLQLPVQFKDHQLHSELYVLTRKKALQDAPGNISVLLHLDMEHLGPMNVYLTMNGNSIRAQFHMSDDETVQLVKTNLPLLSEALAKKGFTLNSEVADDYKKPDFSRDFIEEGLADGEIRSYTFDIRT